MDMLFAFLFLALAGLPIIWVKQVHNQIMFSKVTGDMDSKMSDKPIRVKR